MMNVIHGNIYLILGPSIPGLKAPMQYGHLSKKKGGRIMKYIKIIQEVLK